MMPKIFSFFRSVALGLFRFLLLVSNLYRNPCFILNCLLAKELRLQRVLFSQHFPNKDRNNLSYVVYLETFCAHWSAIWKGNKAETIDNGLMQRKLLNERLRQRFGNTDYLSYQFNRVIVLTQKTYILQVFIYNL